MKSLVVVMASMVGLLFAAPVWARDETEPEPIGLEDLALELEDSVYVTGDERSSCPGDYRPPLGYYNVVDPTTPETLRATLHDLIDDHRRFDYEQIKVLIGLADGHPLHPENIIDVYKNAQYGKLSPDWDREHTWPSSYGFSYNNDCNYPYTDCHAVRASDPSYNGARGNEYLDNCPSGGARYPTLEDPDPGDFLACEGSGAHEAANWSDADSWEVWCGRKGDVARSLLYLDVRYEGGTHGVTDCREPDLILTNDPDQITTSGTYMGLLDVLIQWHLEDPVDDCERRRNHIVHQYQWNRNPFVDHPEWVCLLFSDQEPCYGQVPPSPSPTPVLPPTETPTSVPTSPPTIAPTPPFDSPIVQLQLSASVFYPGDRFLLMAHIINLDPQPYYQLPFVLLLDVHGYYFWYPDWAESPTITYRKLNVGPGSSTLTILDFPWPDEHSSGAGLKFYGGFLQEDFTAVLGEYGSATFGWSY